MSDRSERRFNRLLRSIQRYWISAWAVSVLLFLYIPIIIIIVFSFEKGNYSTIPWSGFTLKWYAQLLNTDAAIKSIENSLFVAIVVMIGGTTLGTLGSIALVRQKFRLKSIYKFLLIAPMTVPGLILGVSLLIWFNVLGISRSLYTVMVGQLVFVIPFVTITVTSRLQGFDPSLEEAARDLGATQLTAYRRVTLPLLAPGIISGALFAFTLSFDDFLIAFFTSGLNNTLPIYIFSSITRGISPVINSISSLALVFSMILILISEIIRIRMDSSSN